MLDVCRHRGVMADVKAETPALGEALTQKFPLVSVGIPTYNRPAYLQRAMGFITQQTYPNLEIIVSDNASPEDETKRVVEEHMAKDSRIKYVRQSTAIAPFENFRFVLEASTGEYFMWMADDDSRAPTFIEALMRALQSDEMAVLAFCDIAVVGEDGDRRRGFYSTYLPFFREFMSGRKWIRLMKFFFQDEWFGKANLMYGLMRRSAVDEISLGLLIRHYGFYGLDNLLVFRLLGQGRVVLVDDTLCSVTAGNIKHYATSEAEGVKKKLGAMAGQLKYLLSYLHAADGFIKYLLIVLFPFKLTLFCLRVVMRKIQAAI